MEEAVLGWEQLLHLSLLCPKYSKDIVFGKQWAMAT